MNLKHFFSRRSLWVLLPFILTLPLFAADPATAASQIKERLPQIDAMKEAGEVGETADGLLQERKALGPRQKAILEAENADRLVIYQSIAKKTGQSVGAVGQQRAIRIAELAKSGVWLRKPDGSWYQKP